MVCWIEGGAGFVLFRVLRGAVVELPGRSRPAPGVVAIRRGRFVSHTGSHVSRARRAPIPASSDTDRPARTAWAALRLLADVADSILVISVWGATMELGRSGRTR
jgi:hypothetical protein